MVQIHHVVFAPVTFPRAAVLNFFFLFCFFGVFLSCFFPSLHFDIPLFLENCSIASHHFFTYVLGITQKVTSLKKPFYSISPSGGSHFEVHLSSFWGVLLCFLELFPISSYEIVYRFFFISL